MSRSATGQGAPWDLWIVGPGASRGRRLSLDAENPAWSPDGRFVAFERCRKKDVTGFYCDSRDIYVVSASGGTPRALTLTPRRDERDPQWSPDGERISFQAFPGFYAVNADGTGLRKVLDWGYEPVFSRDWRHIAFLGRCAAGFQSSCDLRISDARGKAVRRLRLRQPVFSFAWRP